MILPAGAANLRRLQAALHKKLQHPGILLWPLPGHASKWAPAFNLEAQLQVHNLKLQNNPIGPLQHASWASGCISLMT